MGLTIASKTCYLSKNPSTLINPHLKEDFVNRIGVIFALLVLAVMVFVGVQFSRGRQEPKSFITKVTASERLVERFTLADSCAMLLNKVYFPPRTFVEVFYDSLTKNVNVYGRLRNQVIRQATMPAHLSAPESSSHIVQSYFDQMVGFLTRSHEPYFWIAERGVLDGFDMGLIEEHVPIACRLAERLWSPPFVFTAEDSIVDRELGIGVHHLREVAAYAKAYNTTSQLPWAHY